MAKPIKLSVKSLKRHIKDLQSSFNFRVRWGSRRPNYNSITCVLNLPYIYSSVEYIMCLHEIGHFLDNEIKIAADVTRSLLIKAKKLMDLDIKRMTPENSNKVNRKLNRLSKQVELLTTEMLTDEWRWNNEKKAWRYAYKHSLVWNKKCDISVLNCMNSYYATADRKNDKKVISYKKFHKKYIQSIYASRNPDSI